MRRLFNCFNKALANILNTPSLFPPDIVYLVPKQNVESRRNEIKKRNFILFIGLLVVIPDLYSGLYNTQAG